MHMHHAATNAVRAVYRQGDSSKSLPTSEHRNAKHVAPCGRRMTVDLVHGKILTSVASPAVVTWREVGPEPFRAISGMGGLACYTMRFWGLMATRRVVRERRHGWMTSPSVCPVTVSLGPRKMPLELNESN